MYELLLVVTCLHVCKYIRLVCRDVITDAQLMAASGNVQVDIGSSDLILAVKTTFLYGYN